MAFLLFTLALIAKASEMPLTEFYLNLFLGWGMFLRRVATQLSVNWSAVATGILCLVLIWIGLHLFLRWLTTAMRAGDNSAIPPSTTRKKRWTSSIVGVVLLMFVAGISFIGVVHQTSWLAASPEPYVEQRVAWFRGPSKDLLRGMGLATQNYHDIHQASPHHRLDKKGNHSWLTAILPFGRLTVELQAVGRPRQSSRRSTGHQQPSRQLRRPLAQRRLAVNDGRLGQVLQQRHVAGGVQGPGASSRRSSSS